jgi:cyclophilin family peptidyl-prolyl cis-trans isomerase
MNSLRRLALASLSAALALPMAALAQSASVAPAASCAAAGAKGPARVKLTTSMGAIVLELDRVKAPASVENFLKYMEAGHYDGTVFHRVIDGFMIQGGGFTRDMGQKPTRPPIRNEADNGLKNLAYSVAMARTNVPDSATSQFYINVADNAALDYAGPQKPGYAVFGKVVEGKEVVDKIRKVATKNHGPYQNVPAEPVIIEKAACA